MKHFASASTFCFTASVYHTDVIVSITNYSQTWLLGFIHQGAEKHISASHDPIDASPSPRCMTYKNKLPDI